MWAVLGPLLRVLRGLRLLGGLRHGSNRTRLRIALGVALWVAYGFASRSHHVGLAVALGVCLTVLVSFSVARVARRTFRGRHG